MTAEPAIQLAVVDRAALTTILRQMTAKHTLAVAEWHVRPLVRGSAAGKVYRLTGSGIDHGVLIPWSLILKFVPIGHRGDSVIVFDDQPTRFTYWRRELLFYRSELPATLPPGLRAPTCYQVTEQADGYWLWLEDVPDVCQHDWPIARFAVSAQHLGRFNGLYLTSKALPTYPWLTADKDVMRAWERRVIDQESWSQLPHLREQHPLVRRGWPDDVLTGMARLWQERKDFFAALARLPTTLIHSDSGQRNLLAQRSPDGKDETVAVDWALVGLGTIGEEIATHVCATLMWFGIKPGQLAELDEAVFTGYLQGLREVGWQSDPKSVRLGYAASAALRFGLLLMSFVEVIALDQESRALWEGIFGRSMEEIADNMAVLRRFVLARADEARLLLE